MSFRRLFDPPRSQRDWEHEAKRSLERSIARRVEAEKDAMVRRWWWRGFAAAAGVGGFVLGLILLLESVL